MIAILLCVIALLLTLWAGKRSLVEGLLVLFGFGYFYGILRANLPTTASHFLFDASLFGFYLSQDWSTKSEDVQRTASIQSWIIVLIAWPCLLSLVPFQNLLVTLVGLRGNIFFLPLILFGSRLKGNDVRLLALGLAGLNLIALGFGAAEYILGIESFFPRNDVTFIIYASNDVGGGAYRIPSVFMSAHAYAGAMVMTLPLLFAAWMQRDQKKIQRQLLIFGLVAAILGVLLSATRLHFVVAATLVIVALVVGGMSISKSIVWIAALALIGIITLGNDRLQRFSSLNDSNLIESRISGSVNSQFSDILHDYPLGNGLGGGGTSMPYFLVSQVRNQVAMENEYARILAEQGVIGLLLWAAFITWYLFIGTAFQATKWRGGRILAWCACTLYFATGLIGTGLLSAVPHTPLLLLVMGWVSTSQCIEKNHLQISSIIPLRRSLSSTFSI